LKQHAPALIIGLLVYFVPRDRFDDAVFAFLCCSIVVDPSALQSKHDKF